MPNKSIEEVQLKRSYQFLFIVGIIFVSFNLRPTITSVGPLVGTIRDDVGFSNWSVALLTSLPLVAFAIMSPLVIKISRRYTEARALIIGLILLGIGISLRSIPFMTLLFIGTMFIGFGIAVFNVLLPGIIKDKFPTKVSLMTSVYTASMAVFATIGAAVSVPIADGLNLGWEIALFIWIIPVIAALIIWLIISKKYYRRDSSQQYIVKNKSKNTMWTSSFAWKIAFFTGFQSSLFYICIAWIPEILIDMGISKASAGYLLSYFQFLGIPASFLIPMIATKLKSQSIFVVVMNVFYLLGMVLLLLKPSFPLVVLAITVLGVATRGNLVLALLFFAIRSNNARHTRELSSMAQTIGYIVAAGGPIVIGFIYDLTGTWKIPLFIIMGLIICIIYFGYFAGQNKYVLEANE